MFTEEIIEKIKNGGIGIIPTEKMYGLLGSALNQVTVEKIFTLRWRDPSKPLVVLVGSLEDISIFNPNISEDLKKILEKIMPGQVNVIIPVPDKKFDYISRGTQTIAMRLPDSVILRDFLKQTGPLVAPSANTQDMPPAETIDEAKKYFPSLDFYVDNGRLPNNPSTLISIENGKTKILRQGEWQVPDYLI